MKNTELDPRFKIRAPLRCDGIGRLDCAEDTVSGGRLAVRWLPLDANGEQAAKACETLPLHPTLPRIRKTGTANGSAWVAMDFPDGRLMSTVLDEPLPGDVLAAVGAQISDALASIHSQGVFHGELSAESVLLVPGNKAFLWDMPLVIANRLTDRRGEERLMHQLVRTAPFLSPERARGAAPTAEGDVYALAAVLCLAGGAAAPSTKSTLGVVHLVGTHGWAPSVPLRFAEPMRRMLERMLDREPPRRPSAREVADLLGRPAALPTVPEMQAIRLPPDVLARALAQKPLDVREGVAVPGQAAGADEAADAVGSYSDADALGAGLHHALQDAAEALRAAALEPESAPLTEGAPQSEAAMSRDVAQAVAVSPAMQSGRDVASQPSAVASAPQALGVSPAIVSGRDVASQPSAVSLRSAATPASAASLLREVASPAAASASAASALKLPAAAPLRQAAQEALDEAQEEHQTVEQVLSADDAVVESFPDAASAARALALLTAPPTVEMPAAQEPQPLPQRPAPKLPRSVERAIAVTQPFQAPAPQVQLTDTLSVSPELVQEGAVALSLEDSGAFRLRRSKLPRVLGGVGAALLAGALVVGGVMSSRKPTLTAPVLRAPVAVRAEVVAPTPPPQVEEEDLAPLPTPRPARARKVPVAPVQAAAPVEAPAEAPAKAASAASGSESDFGFLEPGEQPGPELKRPQL